MARLIHRLLPAPFAVACSLCAVALPGCDVAPTEIATGDVTSQLAKGGKPGGPGGGDEEPGTYALTDLGVGGASSISAAGVIVGGLGPCCNHDATVWGLDRAPVPLGNLGGTNVWPNEINPLGTRVVGEWWVDGAGVQQPVFWDLDGTAVTASGFLSPLPGWTGGQAFGVNDAGEAAGVSSLENSGGQMATFWEADGTPHALETPPDRPWSIAVALNNAGHAVGWALALGQSTLRSRALLWVVDGTNVTVIDLTSDSDESGNNVASGVSEASGGIVTVVGESTLADQTFPTVWTVDAATGAVVDVLRVPDLGTPRDINMAGEVTLGLGGGQAGVWEMATNTVETLPGLSSRCSSGAYSINDDGAVVGRSWARVRGACEAHAVIWTKNGS